MKTLIINWLLGLLQPKYTKQQIKRINSTKTAFELFFNGLYDELDAQVNVTTWQLGVTDLKFTFKDNLLIVEVTLLRPGLLIGKGGSTYNKLLAYLTSEKEPVKIEIKESKLWNRVK